MAFERKTATVTMGETWAGQARNGQNSSAQNLPPEQAIQFERPSFDRKDAGGSSF
jgi:hypothetical protein